MPTALLDDFDLDIQIGHPHQIGTPMMASSRPWSDPCCSHSCPVECQPSIDC